jgi:hypothetical protein
VGEQRSIALTDGSVIVPQYVFFAPCESNDPCLRITEAAAHDGASSKTRE